MAIETPKKRSRSRKKHPTSRELIGYEHVHIEVAPSDTLNNAPALFQPRTPKQVEDDYLQDQRVALSTDQIVLLSQQLLTLKDLNEQTRASLEFSVKYYRTEKISEEMVLAASRHSLYMIRQAQDNGQLTGVRIERFKAMNQETNTEKPKVSPYQQNRSIVEKASLHPIWQSVPNEIKTFLNLIFRTSSTSTAEERIDMIGELADMMGIPQIEARIQMKHWLEIFKNI
jgi:hypothetical protein